MDPLLLQGIAVIGGMFVGTALVSRVGGWIHARVVARRTQQKSIVTAILLHSGPWIAAATVYWAWYVLSDPHPLAWDLFFSCTLVTIAAWIVYMMYSHYRSKPLDAGDKSGHE